MACRPLDIQSKFRSPPRSRQSWPCRGCSSSCTARRTAGSFSRGCRTTATSPPPCTASARTHDYKPIRCVSSGSAELFPIFSSAGWRLLTRFPQRETGINCPSNDNQCERNTFVFIFCTRWSLVSNRRTEKRSVIVPRNPLDASPHGNKNKHVPTEGRAVWQHSGVGTRNQC